MNYRHEFHAGNFADVLKHVVLSRVLLYLAGKAAPFRYIDTHAGSGLYDLTGTAAAKTGEWRAGIARFAEAAFPPDVAALVAPYLAVVGREPGSYPGSPLIAAALLRRQDRLICCDVAPTVVATLRGHLGRKGKVVAIDGFAALKAFLPPVERRGVALIDPPFEDPDEFDRLLDAFAAAWRRWPTGVYMLWFPLKDEAGAKAFTTALAACCGHRLLQLELNVGRPAVDGRLGRCALAIVNPPHVLAGEAALILPHMAACLATGPGAGYRIELPPA